MPEPFFQRLRQYYLDVAAVLRGEAKAASVFPNPSDVGGSRERVYAEFLRQHAPSKCNVFFGGFLFGDDGTESSQLDVIVTTDTTPRYNFNNANESGKSFSPVEGTLGVASIKSVLNKHELEDTLRGIAAIPPTTSLEKRVTLGVSIKNYEDWPYKIVFAFDGISPETLMAHLEDFYSNNPGIPLGRRPNVIHVAGKYVVFRTIAGMSEWDSTTKTYTSVKEGAFRLFVTDADLQGVLWALEGLQSRANASTHILYSYGEVINKINGLPPVSAAQQNAPADAPNDGAPLS